jgi:hypothetical protein
LTLDAARRDVAPAAEPPRSCAMSHELFRNLCEGTAQRCY